MIGVTAVSVPPMSATTSTFTDTGAALRFGSLSWARISSCASVAALFHPAWNAGVVTAALVRARITRSRPSPSMSTPEAASLASTWSDARVATSLRSTGDDAMLLAALAKAGPSSRARSAIEQTSQATRAAAPNRTSTVDSAARPSEPPMTTPLRVEDAFDDGAGTPRSTKVVLVELRAGTRLAAEQPGERRQGPEVVRQHVGVGPGGPPGTEHEGGSQPRGQPPRVRQDLRVTGIDEARGLGSREGLEGCCRAKTRQPRRMLELDQLNGPLDVGQATSPQLEVSGGVDAAWEPLGLHPVSYTHLRAHETRHDLVC